MLVYALVGKSGTGKSHHCMHVACENNIDYIIDDGLLITGGKIIAGKSAKRETTKIASVHRAIFSDPSHAEEVRRALKKNRAKSLLIIGTSDRMVNKIAQTLGVLPIEKIIHIEDVTSPEEREIAADMRNREGKHIIPVPAFELKRQFSGYFTDSIMLLFKNKGKTITEEKTVMRPSYSYLGDYKIAPKVIYDICNYELSQMPHIHSVKKIKVTTSGGGFLTIKTDVSVKFPCRVSKETELAAQRVKEAVEGHTGIIVRKVTVNPKDLYMGDGK